MSAVPHSWDGSTAIVCDKVGCTKPPVLHADLAPALDGECHGSEASFCSEHISELVQAARLLLVVNRIVPPADETERRVLAVVMEHLP